MHKFPYNNRLSKSDNKLVITFAETEAEINIHIIQWLNSTLPHMKHLIYLSGAPEDIKPGQLALELCPGVRWREVLLFLNTHNFKNSSSGLLTHKTDCLHKIDQRNRKCVFCGISDLDILSEKP